jgi:hypothetical protein
MGMNYAAMSLAEVRAELRNVARDTQATFGDLDEAQLNWRPGAAQWSVAQCFQHLFTANALVLRSAQDAATRPVSSAWQRIPLLPRIFGRLLIRSQAPSSRWRFTAPPKARPTAIDLPRDIIERFVGQQIGACEWMETVDEGHASRSVMTSPFVRFVTYRVLDGCRLLVAHDRRHFEQARRVLQAREFPASSA